MLTMKICAKVFKKREQNPEKNVWKFKKKCRKIVP